MSEIRDMNADVRKRSAYWSVATVVLAMFAAVPDAVFKLFEGEFQKKLWWIALVGGFLVIFFVLEGLGVGRRTAHRAKIDKLIVGRIIRAICSNPSCPQVASPTPSARRSAMGLFYSKIDAASREVAFYYWGWYYFAIFAIWSAATSLVLSLVAASQFRTDALAVRWVAVTILATGLGIAWRILKNFQKKTIDHADQQLMQVKNSLGTTLPDAECPEPACPST